MFAVTRFVPGVLLSALLFVAASGQAAGPSPRDQESTAPATGPDLTGYWDGEIQGRIAYVSGGRRGEDGERRIRCSLAGTLVIQNLGTAPSPRCRIQLDAEERTRYVWVKRLRPGQSVRRNLRSSFLTEEYAEPYGVTAWIDDQDLIAESDEDNNAPEAEIGYVSVPADYFLSGK